MDWCAESALRPLRVFQFQKLNGLGCSRQRLLLNEGELDVVHIHCRTKWCTHTALEEASFFDGAHGLTFCMIWRRGECTARATLPRGCICTWSYESSARNAKSGGVPTAGSAVSAREPISCTYRRVQAEDAVRNVSVGWTRDE